MAGAAEDARAVAVAAREGDEKQRALHFFEDCGKRVVAP
jgi:hypothetical protein